MNGEALRTGVTSWWSANRADRDQLPWRQTKDAWQILVSETMLSQTQVSRVATRFPEVIDRFPTVQSCAAAPLGEVIRAWTGLGYNRRAMNLHAAARRIVDVHGGVVPRSLRDLLALPGVGAYTARAVSSFAYGGDEAVVDTNVRRVIVRAFIGHPVRPPELQLAADTLLPVGESKEWNLALMDFGSLVCSSRSPKCSDCGVGASGGCAWRNDSSTPDPAHAQASAISKQRPFVGSDRQGRGRLIKAACSRPITWDEVATISGWPDDEDRARRVARGLCMEGLLIEEPSGLLRLP